MILRSRCLCESVLPGKRIAHALGKIAPYAPAERLVLICQDVCDFLYRAEVCAFRSKRKKIHYPKRVKDFYASLCEYLRTLTAVAYRYLQNQVCPVSYSFLRPYELVRERQVSSLHEVSAHCDYDRVCTGLLPCFLYMVSVPQMKRVVFSNYANGLHIILHEQLPNIKRSFFSSLYLLFYSFFLIIVYKHLTELFVVSEHFFCKSLHVL